MKGQSPGWRERGSQDRKIPWFGCERVDYYFLLVSKSQWQWAYKTPSEIQMVCFSLAGFIPQRVGVPRISKGDFLGVFRLVIIRGVIISEILADYTKFWMPKLSALAQEFEADPPVSKSL
jgi:hypothetical protein